MKEEQQELIEEQYEEDALGTSIGIGRHRIQEVRKTALGSEPGALWSYVTGGRVGYTKKGVERLLEALGVELPKKGSAVDTWKRKNLREVLDDARMGPAGDLDGCYRAMVTQVANMPTMMFAGILNHGTLPYGFSVRVKVRDNSHFTHGMEIQVRPIDETQYLFQHVGAMPRARGRW
jgi:hypothetical protein